jgi:1-acyl-sn-glycerol-3-phosphate acyltransferase
MLFFSRVRVTLRGRELLEPQHTYVFAANHQSYLDIPVLFAYLPAQFRIMAKQVLFRFPVVGWHLRRAGHMPIPRANPRRAARSLLEATDYLNRGISVFVFPEGTRSPDGQLGQFKLGAFLLAIKGGAPVVPVTINGTGALMKLNSWHIRPGRVEMVVHPPIATAGMTSESAEQLCEQARAAIASAIELPAKLLHV